jgi:hypothetical protein
VGLLLGATPALLGIVVLRCVRESHAGCRSGLGTRPPLQRPFEVFRPPLLRLTLLGIALARSTAGRVGFGQRLVRGLASSQATWHATAQALTQVSWAVGAVLGSLLGGWLANRLGRRVSYFFIGWDQRPEA